MISRYIDMAGKSFGSLLAIRPAGVSCAGNIEWIFQCVCGNERICDGYTVRTGKVKACSECTKKTLVSATLIHGMTNTEEFSIWTGILNRCYNHKSKAYKYYGKRGILVDEKWLASFEAFFLDMGKRPSKNHSIDRVNPNGNYTKENCRWATFVEQANNKTSNVNIELNGQVKTAKEWSRELNIAYATLLYRFNRGLRGDDLLKPSKRLGSIECDGVRDTIAGWSSRTGIKSSTIAMRISKYGWSVKKSLGMGE